MSAEFQLCAEFNYRVNLEISTRFIYYRPIKLNYGGKKDRKRGKEYKFRII